MAEESSSRFQDDSITSPNQPTKRMNTKIKNALLLVGFLLAAAILIFTKGGKDVLIQFYQNLIRRRKNEIKDLEARESKLREQLHSNDIAKDVYDAKIVDIQKRREEIKDEVKKLDDQGLASNVGDLLGR